MEGLNSNGNRRGRPKLIIDYKLVQRLADIHCTQTEIASALGVSVDTLQRNKEFCGLYKKGLDEGRASLRRLQWAAAEGIEPKLVLDNFGQPSADLKGKPIFTLGQLPNVTMQIWLGKQILGQADKQEIDYIDKVGGAENLSDEELADIIKSRRRNGITKEEKGS